jgi:polyphenol oxidase
MVKFTRRDFARTMLVGSVASSFGRSFAQDNCAPPTGTPVDFVIPKLQNIQRKAIATLSASEVARLRLAYKKLRDLTVSDPTDPRGWMQQASVHCWQCGASGNNIHGSWTFLPWHRAFLYFHERILCKLLNDNSFRLPYWSWDDQHTRDLPAVYRAATVGSDPNPLYDAHRSSDAVKGKSMPGSIFPTRQNPMNAGNFASFGGSSASAGALEMGPHGAIHMWAGTQDDPWADMGNLMLAGRDPIFFAHHCNLDRLWAEWNRRNTLAHANPTDAAFLTRSFQFFDENKQLVNIRAQDVLDPVKLGFSYLPGAGLSEHKLPKWTPLKYDSTTHLIQLPNKLRAAVTAPSLLATQRSLVIEEVQLPMKSGSYNVFVGDPPAVGADQSTAPNYLGYIGIIVSEHMHENKCSLVLDPTNQFLQAASGAGALLTFAPAGTTDSNRLEFTSAYLTEE